MGWSSGVLYELDSATHALTSAEHTASGLTTGHVLKASSASAFGFESAAHVLNSSDHTVSGLTAGTLLQATAATTFAFTANAKIDDTNKSLTFGTTVLIEDAANVWALRNGTTAQASRLYNTFTSSTNHEFAAWRWSSNVLEFQTVAGSAGGTIRAMLLGSGLAVGTDQAGASTTLVGGKGTGSGTPGTLLFQTSTTLGTGSTGQSLVTRLTLSGGAVTTDFWTLTVGSTGSLVCQSAALATNATHGFVYIPTSAGAPSGVPASQTGTVAMEYDTTNDRIYFYNGAWRYITATA